jgi:serine/threonine protein kinase
MNLIGKGTYSDVFETKDKIIVKHMYFLNEDNELDYETGKFIQPEIKEPNLREVCFLSTIENCPYFTEIIKVNREDEFLVLYQKNKGINLDDFSKIVSYEKKIAFLPHLLLELSKILLLLKSANIAHRDIKSTNICINDDKKISLIDFGLIHPLYKDVNDGFNDNKYFFHDPDFDNKNIDYKFDMYSLGKTIYVYLTNNYSKNFNINNLDKFEKDISPEIFNAWKSMFSNNDRITPEKLYSILCPEKFEMKIIYKKYNIDKNLQALIDANSKIDINSKMLYILAEWMIDVLSFEDLFEELFIHSIQIVLRYISIKNIDRTKLQLLGTSSMYLSAILNNSNLNHILLSKMTQGAFTPKKVVKFADIVSKKLNYEIYPYIKLYRDELSNEKLSNEKLSKKQMKEKYLDKENKRLKEICFD